MPSKKMQTIPMLIGAGAVVGVGAMVGVAGTGVGVAVGTGVGLGTTGVCVGGVSVGVTCSTSEGCSVLEGPGADVGSGGAVGVGSSAGTGDGVGVTLAIVGVPAGSGPGVGSDTLVAGVAVARTGAAGDATPGEVMIGVAVTKGAGEGAGTGVTGSARGRDVADGVWFAGPAGPSSCCVAAVGDMLPHATAMTASRAAPNRGARAASARSRGLSGAVPDSVTFSKSAGGCGSTMRPSILTLPRKYWLLAGFTRSRPGQPPKGRPHPPFLIRRALFYVSLSPGAGGIPG